MVRYSWYRNFVLLVLAECVSGGLASGQEAVAPELQTRNSGSTPQTIFRSTVRRVVVDVVVTDAQGKAVPGLTRSDFSLKEDKKEQRILSFDDQNFAASSFVPPKVRPLPANTFVNLPKEAERGPLYVIYYDMVNLEMADQMTSRKPLLDFIDNKPDGTRFAIFIHTDGLHLVQGFTQDREVLRAAITSSGPGPHLPKVFLYGGIYGAGNTYNSVSIIKYLADYLQGMPGRKNLIWVASQFPATLFANPNVDDLNLEITRQALTALGRSEITLYPVDAQGVVNDTNTPAAAYQNEEALADVTGGHAYFGGNDLRAKLDKAVEQGSSYYTLSYSPDDGKYDGSLRNIQLSLNQEKFAKSGYKLTYRHSYYAIDPGASEAKRKPDLMQAYWEAAKQNDTLYGSIQHGGPMVHDLVFAAHVRASGEAALATPAQMAQIEDEPAYFRTRNKRKPVSSLPPVKLQRYLIDYQVIDSLLKSVASQTGRRPMLEFAAAGYDSEGRMLNGVLNDAMADAPSNGGKEGKLFRVEQEFYLPAEAAWLRVAVRDTLTDRTGTLEIRLPLQPEPANQGVGQVATVSGRVSGR